MSRPMVHRPSMYVLRGSTIVTPSVIQWSWMRALHDRRRLGEMLPGVDAEDIVRLEDIERQDLTAHGLEVFGGVGEVVFALGVAGAELVESVPQSG